HRRLPMWNQLSDIRKCAALKLHEAVDPKGKSARGIYKTAERLFSKSDEWEERIRLTLNCSKAARAFVVPLGLIFLYYVLRASLNLSAPAWLTSPLVWSVLSPWQTPLVLSIIAFLTYMCLRVRHMIALYTLVTTTNIFSFSVCDRSGEQHKVICVADVV